MNEPILVALVGLFIAVLVLRMIKAYLFAKRLKGGSSSLPEAADSALLKLVNGVETPQQAKEAIRQIGRQAPSLKSSAVRAAYHCAAGNLAVNPLKRPGLAVGLYLKALRADPTCIEALHKLQDLLAAQKRFRRLERTYWEVLARLDDSEIGDGIWLSCWSGLAAIYSASPRTIRRADAIRKALSAFVVDSEEVEEASGISNLPKAAP